MIGDREEASNVTCFTITENSTEMIIAYSNDIINHFSLSVNAVATRTSSNSTLVHQFRGTHKAPILLMRTFSKGIAVKSGDNQEADDILPSEQSILLLATGGADFAVKLWDLRAQYCTHNFHGKSVVSALSFIDNGGCNSKQTGNKLAIGYAEGNIRIVDLGSIVASPKKAEERRRIVEWKHHKR